MSGQYELLPCPFCGGEAHYTKAVNGSNMIYCGCGPCGIRFKAQNIYHTDATWKPTMDVIAAWNTRLPPKYKSQEVFDVAGRVVEI